MEYRQRKPGSVRLTEEQYEEMERLGIDNESAYVKHKLNGAQQHLQVLRNDAEILQSEQSIPAKKPTFQMGISEHLNYSKDQAKLQDQLAIQKLSLENDQLKHKLEELSRSREEALDGIHGQVSNLLRDELLKRDFEAAKKDNAALLKEIEKLEKALEKSEDTLDEKSAEIDELIKKLSMIELGKALLPGAISGLASKYPKEIQGLATTLGSLSGEDMKQLLPANSLSEEQQNLLQIAEYFKELFNDEQFEQVVQLIAQLGEQTKEDESMIGKVSYYLTQMSKIRKTKQQAASSQQEGVNTIQDNQNGRIQY
ncbi:hypothetical protein GCM10011506_30060 [Marivirga lumbricoides]|uniref:Uncharacterized protein n=1 Tax=Marivirga lumbricoides TaxID=1046115 RepID=A0ABQ1MQK6_9BACT|nr:hypothetical protein GCM10011506_30060 [Marivirga lumbricoides]